MYKEHLALNNLRWLICHKTQPDKVTFIYIHSTAPADWATSLGGESYPSAEMHSVFSTVPAVDVLRKSCHFAYWILKICFDSKMHNECSTLGVFIKQFIA